MLRSLVGSEMCIRDSLYPCQPWLYTSSASTRKVLGRSRGGGRCDRRGACVITRCAGTSKHANRYIDTYIHTDVVALEARLSSPHRREVQLGHELKLVELEEIRCSHFHCALDVLDSREHHEPLQKIMAGLNKADSGDVLLLDRDVSSCSTRDRARHIGWMDGAIGNGTLAGVGRASGDLLADCLFISLAKT